MKSVEVGDTVVVNKAIDAIHYRVKAVAERLVSVEYWTTGMGWVAGGTQDISIFRKPSAAQLRDRRIREGLAK